MAEQDNNRGSQAGTVKSAIEALKSNPLLLAVMLLNALFVIAALFYLRAEQRQMDAMIKACVEQRR
jgi:hypothetical protein